MNGVALRQQRLRVQQLAQLIGEIAYALDVGPRILHDKEDDQFVDASVGIIIRQANRLETYIAAAYTLAFQFPRKRIIQRIKEELFIVKSEIGNLESHATRAAQRNKRYAIELVLDACDRGWEKSGPKLQRFEAKLRVIADDLKNQITQLTPDKSHSKPVVPRVVVYCPKCNKRARIYGVKKSVRYAECGHCGHKFSKFRGHVD